MKLGTCLEMMAVSASVQLLRGTSRDYPVTFPTPPVSTIILLVGSTNFAASSLVFVGEVFFGWVDAYVCVFLLLIT
jgi:hypothetical protein